MLDGCSMQPMLHPPHSVWTFSRSPTSLPGADYNSARPRAITIGSARWSVAPTRAYQQLQRFIIDYPLDRAVEFDCYERHWRGRYRMRVARHVSMYSLRHARSIRRKIMP